MQNVEIFNVLDITEVKGTFRVQFQLELTWFDSRVEFYNLKDTGINTLSRAEQLDIWVTIFLTMPF